MTTLTIKTNNVPRAARYVQEGAVVKNYNVVKRDSYTNEFIGVVAGLGRNRGTWDSEHTKRTAKEYAKRLNAIARGHMSGYVYTVESSTMSRRTFESLVAHLRTTRPEGSPGDASGQWCKDVSAVADALRAVNPAFDRRRFINDCLNSTHAVPRS